MSGANGANGVSVREKAVRFGKSATLVGVLSEPVSAVPGAPAVLLLNSGILHRVGACRLYVQLARAIAAQGFVVLRFDYSGIGDSEARKDSLAFEESAVVETREAMDWLTQTKGTQRFVLAGLCSGADMAHETARVDERVAGLGMIDPYAYRTPAFWLHYYAHRVVRWSYWKRFVSVRAQRLLARGGTRAVEGADAVTFDVPKYVRVFPPRDRVAADLRQFVARGVRMLTLFSAGLGDEYNHLGQYAASFPDVALCGLHREAFVEESDHIFTRLDHQRAVVDTFVDWSRQLLAPGATARTAAATAGEGRTSANGAQARVPA